MRFIEPFTLHNSILCDVIAALDNILLEHPVWKAKYLATREATKTLYISQRIKLASANSISFIINAHIFYTLLNTIVLILYLTFSNKNRTCTCSFSASVCPRCQFASSTLVDIHTYMTYLLSNRRTRSAAIPVSCRIMALAFWSVLNRRHS